MMSKKDYIAIAKIIKGRLSNDNLESEEQRKGLKCFIFDLSNCFEQDNPKFRRDLFLKACEVEE